MSGREKLAEQVCMIFRQRGTTSEEMARKAVLHEMAVEEPVRSALVYFFDRTPPSAQFPALISLACEAVGGDPATTGLLGAAVLLLAGAAELHDDIVDQSTTKYERSTVLGKYGINLALLSGDLLLFRGLTLLSDSCSTLMKRKKDAILQLVTNAFFELGYAEAKEVSIRGTRIIASDVLKIIHMRASLAEANMKIGAIIGGASTQQVKKLGRIGRTLGVLTTMRDEFVDMYEPAEIRNRCAKEILPLPVIYGLTDKKAGKEIQAILLKDVITENDAYRLVDLVMKNAKVRKLILQMHNYVKKATQELKLIKRKQVAASIKLALRSTVEDL
jgi:geranylgeranyl pyrophosphate synthase